MKTQTLGHTGVEVSSLCLGTLNFGSRDDEATSYRILDHYVDAGGTFLDTANTYAMWVEGCHGGESETLLGKWMQERGNRNDLFIATKCGLNYQDVPISLSAKRIEEECNKSLKRMGIETIDLYYGHRDDRATPLEESLEAFDRLVQAGKVRYIGASNYMAWRLEQARWISDTNDWAKFCCIQQRYTYLPIRRGVAPGRQSEANKDLLDYCLNSGTTMIAYSVLLSGSYTRTDRPLQDWYRNADNEERLTVLRTIAEEVGVSANQVILAWMRQSSPSVLPLIAASSIEQLQENLDSQDVALSDEQMERLNTAGTT